MLVHKLLTLNIFKTVIHLWGQCVGFFILVYKFSDYLALGQFNLKKIYPIDASSLWTKTPEEIEEKRAIKEMCYKSGKKSNICIFSNIWCEKCTNHWFSCGRLGEYYRVHTPSDISSSKSIASIVEKEIDKSLESGSELQEGKEWKGSFSRWWILGVIGCGLLSVHWS